MQGGWTEAPHLIEEVYNVEDALVVAQWMNVFLRRCNVLKIACLAQIVNVIAPLLTTSNQVLRQTTFYPFMFYSRYSKGLALDVLTQAPRYETRAYGNMPVLDVSATYDPATEQSAVFLVNRSQTEPLTTELIWQAEAPQQIRAVYQLACDDPKAANTFQQPETVTPRMIAGAPVSDHTTTLTLPPLSFTVVTC